MAGGDARSARLDPTDSGYVAPIMGMIRAVMRATDAEMAPERTISFDADNYPDGYERAMHEVPEGWKLLRVEAISGPGDRF